MPSLRVLDFGTQTSRFAFVIEIGTIDHPFQLVVKLQGKEAADAAPKSHSFHRDNDYAFVADFAQINILSSQFGLFFHHLAILGFGLSAVESADVERIENLLLLVEGHVCVLHRLQRLIDESQQEGHDDHEYRTIYNNVRVAVCVQFHFVPPLLIRFEMFRSTMKWSIIGAHIFPKKMASIIPSG